VALSPLALGAAIVDLLTGDAGGAGRRFYGVLRLGRRSERWIDLFGAAGRTGRADADTEAPGGVDAAVARVERLLAEQVERGGMTTSAKDAVDRALDAVSRRRGARRGDHRDDPDRPGA
jgi:hypothetical protein